MLSYICPYYLIQLRALNNLHRSGIKMVPENRTNLNHEENKGTFQKRFSGIRPLRGYPPPTPPLLTENQSEKKKVFFLSGKGGYPHPPLNGKSAKLFREFFS